MKKIIAILILIFGYGLSVSAQSITWEIFKVDKYRYNTGDLGFTIYLTNNPSSEYFMWADVKHGIDSLEIRLLLEYFEAKTADNLIGKKFETGETVGSYALSYLIIDLKNNGNYTPPSDEDLRRRIVESFTQMRAPIFEDVDERTMTRFGRSEFKLSYEANWLDTLKEKVYKESNGTVILSKLNNNCVPSGYVVRTAQTFFLLTKRVGDKLEKVIVRFAPFSNPFVSF